MAPLPEAPPDAARRHLRRTGRPHHGRPLPTPPRPAPTSRPTVLDRNTGQIVSNGNGKAMPIASVVKLFIADDLLLQESRGQTEALPRRPRGARRHAAGLRRQRGRDVLEPQWRQRDHFAGHRAIRVGRDDDAVQRALVQHLEHDRRPRSVLRQAARGHRRIAAGTGQHHPVQPGGVHTDRARRHGARRRIPTAVRHSRGALRRARCGQAGLVLLLERRQLGALVDRRDRAGTVDTSWRSARCSPPTTPPPATPSPRPSRRCSPAAASSSRCTQSRRSGRRSRVRCMPCSRRHAAILAWSPDSRISGTSSPRQLGGRV